MQSKSEVFIARCNLNSLQQKKIRQHGRIFFSFRDLFSEAFQFAKMKIAFDSCILITVGTMHCIFTNAGSI